MLSLCWWSCVFVWLSAFCVVPVVSGEQANPHRRLPRPSNTTPRRTYYNRINDFYDTDNEIDILEGLDQDEDEERILSALEGGTHHKSERETDDASFSSYNSESDDSYFGYDDDLGEEEDGQEVIYPLVADGRKAYRSSGYRHVMPRTSDEDDRRYRRAPETRPRGTVPRKQHQQRPTTVTKRPVCSKIQRKKTMGSSVDSSAPPQQRAGAAAASARVIRTATDMGESPAAAQPPKGRATTAPPAVVESRRVAQSKTASSTSSTATTTSPWVRRFLSSCPNDLLLPVPVDYLSDNFNLYGLAAVLEERITHPGMTPVSLYKEALRRILERPPSPASTKGNSAAPAGSTTNDVDSSDLIIEQAAILLYLLVHQRYVMSPRGMDTVRRRLLQQPTLFGQCPLVSCRGAPLLPYSGGDEDGSYPIQNSGWNPSTATRPLASPGAPTGKEGGTIPKERVVSRCQRYCTRCRQVYYHVESQVPGGCDDAWGPGFAPLLLLSYGDEVFGAAHWRQRQPQQEVPRIFGFALHDSVYNIQ